MEVGPSIHSYIFSLQSFGYTIFHRTIDGSIYRWGMYTYDRFIYINIINSKLPFVRSAIKIQLQRFSLAFTCQVCDFLSRRGVPPNVIHRFRDNKVRVLCIFRGSGTVTHWIESGNLWTKISGKFSLGSGEWEVSTPCVTPSFRFCCSCMINMSNLSFTFLVHVWNNCVMWSFPNDYCSITKKYKSLHDTIS